LKQVTKDEMFFSSESQTSQAHQQKNFEVMNLSPFLCPKNSSAVFVGRASTVIICRHTKFTFCLAYLRA